MRLVCSIILVITIALALSTNAVSYKPSLTKSLPPKSAPWSIGYTPSPGPFKSYKDKKLNVHLNCHTHDDVGWLKTVGTLNKQK